MERTETPIGNLVDKIDQGEYALPEMQRKYVWRSTQVSELLDSLYREYPTGDILVWENKDRSIRTMGFSISDDKQEQSRNGHQALLLDGQQRLTSLLAIIKNKDLVVKNRAKPIDILFNLKHPEPDELEEINDINDEDESTDSEVSDVDKVEEGDDSMPDGEYQDAGNDERLKRWAQKAFVPENGRLKSKKHWVSVKEIFSSDAVDLLIESGICKDHRDPNFKKYKDRISKVKDITKYPYNVVKLKSSLQYAEVANIFTRVNSQGTKLKSSDLALSQITVVWRDARKDIEGFQETYSRTGFYFEDIGTYVKALISLITDQCLYKNITQITKEEYEENWKHTKRNMTTAFDLLEEFGVINYHLLSSPFIIILLSYYLHKREGVIGNPEEKALLRKWVLLANAKGRFSRGSSESLLNEDIKDVLDLYKNPLDVWNKLLSNISRQTGPLNITPELLEHRNAGSSYFKTMFIAFKEQGAQDWGREMTINLYPTDNSRKYKIEHHHIFPQALLKDTSYNNNRKMINDISNLAFIGGDFNRKIGKNPPSKYIPEYGIESKVVQQCVPADKELWEISNYEKFLEERRKLIAENLNNFINKG